MWAFRISLLDKSGSSTRNDLKLVEERLDSLLEKIILFERAFSDATCFRFLNSFCLERSKRYAGFNSKLCVKC